MALSPYRTAAQTGETYAQVRFNPKAAQEYLSGEEAANYSAALGTIAQDPKKKKGKYTQDSESKHNSAVDQLNRLRDIAATRGLDDFQAYTANYTKPWKIQPEGGAVVTAQDVNDPIRGGARTFGAETLTGGQAMKDVLAGMKNTAGGPPQLLAPDLLGSYGQRAVQKYAINAKAAGNRSLTGRIASGTASRIGGVGAGGGAAYSQNYARTKARLAAAQTTADVLDPVKAYLGSKGGVAKRNPDFGY